MKVCFWFFCAYAYDDFIDRLYSLLIYYWVPYFLQGFQRQWKIGNRKLWDSMRMGISSLLPLKMYIEESRAFGLYYNNFQFTPLFWSGLGLILFWREENEKDRKKKQVLLQWSMTWSCSVHQTGCEWQWKLNFVDRLNYVLWAEHAKHLWRF